MSTSARSRNSPEADVRRPFAPAVLRRAKAVAARYQMVLWQEDGRYYGRGVELPTAFGDGRTVAACVENTREGFVATVAHLIETGQPVPTPANEAARTEQVNIRLAPDEKRQLEAAAQRKGYRGLSEFMRSAGLAAAD